MRLLWIRYTAKNQSKHGLFMIIGDDGGNLVALKSNAMEQADIKRIRASLKYLEESTIKQRIEWIKQFCPASYRKAFRRMPEGKYKIISEHRPTQ